MRGVVGTINKSKTHDCERNLSYMILEGKRLGKLSEFDKTRVRFLPNFTRHYLITHSYYIDTSVLLGNKALNSYETTSGTRVAYFPYPH